MNITTYRVIVTNTKGEAKRSRLLSEQELAEICIHLTGGGLTERHTIAAIELGRQVREQGSALTFRKGLSIALVRVPAARSTVEKGEVLDHE